MGEKIHSIKFLLLAAVVAVFVSCNKEENTLVYNKAKLAGVQNLRAFSAGANSVALIWSASPDTNKNEFTDVTVTARIGNSVWASRTFSKTFGNATIVIDSLNEGSVYSLEVVSRASANSQNYADSDPVTVLWAPARRLNGGSAVRVYEIAAPDSNGLQFFDVMSGAAHVFSSRTPAYQPILDVVIDSTASGIVIMKSAHLNRYGGGQRHTRFSTFDTLASDLDVARSAPPDPSSYVRDSIFIGPQILTTGKVFYAVTEDSNYVRILFERNTNPNPPDPNSGSLLFGSQPRRYLSMRLSYQVSRGVIFAKPRKTFLERQSQ